MARGQWAPPKANNRIPRPCANPPPPQITPLPPPPLPLFEAKFSSVPLAQEVYPYISGAFGAAVRGSGDQRLEQGDRGPCGVVRTGASARPGSRMGRRRGTEGGGGAGTPSPPHNRVLGLAHVTLVRAAGQGVGGWDWVDRDHPNPFYRLPRSSERPLGSGWVGRCGSAGPQRLNAPRPKSGHAMV